jgi:hypothetical protein
MVQFYCQLGVRLLQPVQTCLFRRALEWLWRLSKLGKSWCCDGFPMPVCLEPTLVGEPQQQPWLSDHRAQQPY